MAWYEGVKTFDLIVGYAADECNRMTDVTNAACSMIQLEILLPGSEWQS